MTPRRQKLGRNPAAQQAFALILANPLSCDPVQGPTMHSRQWKRREFITLVGPAAAAWPLAARAQQDGRVRRIGVLMPFNETDPVAKTIVSAFTQALADLRWTDR